MIKYLKRLASDNILANYILWINEKNPVFHWDFYLNRSLATSQLKQSNDWALLSEGVVWQTLTFYLPRDKCRPVIFLCVVHDDHSKLMIEAI